MGGAFPMAELRFRLVLYLVSGLLLLAPGNARAKTYTYKVKHLHAVGSCQGLLTVGENEVRYESDYRKDSRIWSYIQIKKVERQSAYKLTIHTYEDQTLQLGRDKLFDFEFLDGRVDEELFNFMVTGMSKAKAPEPASAPPGGRWEIAAKHDHLFGGCEGTLKITDAAVEYVTGHSDARLWKYLDIKRFESPSTYELLVYTYEDQTWQFGRDKVFRFELKEPLRPEIYEYMRERLHR